MYLSNMLVIKEIFYHLTPVPQIYTLDIYFNQNKWRGIRRDALMTIINLEGEKSDIFITHMVLRHFWLAFN